MRCWILPIVALWGCGGPGCDDTCGKQTCDCWDYLANPQDKVVDFCVSSFGDTRSYSLEDDDGTEVFSCEESTTGGDCSLGFMEAVIAVCES